MPFLSDTELLDRIQSPNNITRDIVEEDSVELDDEVESNIFPEPNYKVEAIDRTKGNDTPLEIRKTIAVLANIGSDSQKKIGEAFGLTQASVSHLSSGQTCTAAHSDKHKDIFPVVQGLKEDKRTKAEDMALDSLVQALGLVPAGLKSAKSVKTIASVAKTMAEISEKMGGREIGNKSLHLHLYAPNQRSIEEYDTIEA